MARLPFPPNLTLDKGGPLVKLDNLWFELDKHYTNTRIQLLLSPIDISFNHETSGIHFAGI